METLMKNKFKKNKFALSLFRGLKRAYCRYFVSDVSHIKKRYKKVFNKDIDLLNPRTFNEKLQWLKLYDRKDIYTEMVDKYEVRQYVESKIGEKYLIPIIGIWNDFDEIDFSKLPDSFVLKCTHDSGGLVICKNKSDFDIQKARNKINKALKQNYFYHAREWPYKNVKPRIICEKYMVDKSCNELKDYKFFCFNGEPKLMFIASDREVETKFDFYDLEFNKLPIKQYYSNSNTRIKKPEMFEEMISLATELSKGIPHVRIDFYNIGSEIYFGEYTFYHFSGFKKFEPECYDELLGEWIELPKE